MAAVELSKITKSFGETQVLPGVDLRVEDGEFVVLVGPSGCGKSTLLRIIAGLEDADEGDVKIGSRHVNGIDPAKRGIAMVFQSYALYPNMTVRENLGFALKLARASKAEITAAVNKAAEKLKITHLLDRLPRELSGGQRQRVAIGRAIVRKPDVFLFDEPLSNLDAALRGEMRVELARLHRDLGATMVYVTHDQIEAMTLADRVIVLSQGRIEQAGPPLELYDKPTNKFVAGFIGSPTMNFQEGTISGQNGAFCQILLGNGQTVLTAIPANRAAAGAKVTIGFRPEQIQFEGEQNAVTGTVQFIEALGGTTLTHVQVSGLSEPIIIQQSFTSRPPIGEAIRFNIPVQHIHVFDAKGIALY